jgi:hypothetical protein
MRYKVGMVKCYYDKTNTNNTEEVHGYLIANAETETGALNAVIADIDKGVLNTVSEDIFWDDIYMPEDIREYEDWSFDTTCVVEKLEDESL